MTPILALWAVVFGAMADVTSVRVQPAGSRTEVMIEVAGAVSFNHFTLSEPDRLVLDVSGARLALSPGELAGAARGGIRAVRASQFQPEVVRIVVDLEAPVSYTVAQRPDGVSISFPNPDGEFPEWSSDGGDEAMPSARSAASSPVVASPPPEPEEPRISVYFQETPILQVLATFAEFSGRSIVPGMGVADAGAVTADIRAQPWDVALRTILESRGLAASEAVSGIIRVDNLKNLQTLAQAEPMVTRAYPIKYVAVDSILKSVEGLLVAGAGQDSATVAAANPLAAQLGLGGPIPQGPPQIGTVTANRSTNTLLVTAGKSVLDRIEPILAQLDVRAAQVNISAKIIFVERSKLEELGVTYDLKDSRGNQLNQLVGGYIDENGDGRFDSDEQTDENVVLLGGKSIAALGNASARVANPTLQVLSSIVLGRHTLINFIEALSSVALTDVQATPVIRTLDHRQARVQVGENTPIRILDAGAGAVGAGGQAPRATVQMQSTGTILEVTPHVTGNQVLLELHAERSNATVAPSDAGVAFQTQNADTQILLDDGETAVIGGLTLVERSETMTGIPFLMNLPVVGRLFRRTSDREIKRDLLIMVTPHIIRESD